MLRNLQLRSITNDPLGEQRTCYLLPSSVTKDVCAAAPAACKGTHREAHLLFAGAALVGTLPTQLGMLHETLEHLDLSQNMISGTMPSELGRLTRLRTLALHSNRVSASMPSELGRLNQLHYLDLHSNALSGAIPSHIAHINPAYCNLVQDQAPLPATSIDGSSALERDEDHDNRFACPLPALPAACGRHGLAYTNRDAHHTGQCETMPGIAYGEPRDTLGAGDLG